MVRLLVSLICLLTFAVPVAAQVEIVPARTTASNASPTFTGQAKFDNGTAAAPSITFTSDPDTGMYRFGANVVGFSSSGTASARLGFGFSEFRGTLQISSGALEAGVGASFDAMSDGVLRLTNNGGTDFNRLQFGGATALFPSLKRSGTTLAVRLADDSADAPLTASIGSFGSGIPSTVGAVRLANATLIGWRDVGNTANVTLGLLNSDRMSLVGAVLQADQGFFIGGSDGAISRGGAIDGIILNNDLGFSGDNTKDIGGVATDRPRSLYVGGGGTGGSIPGINVNQIWNNAATTFTAAQVKVTNTASNAASMLLDLQVGGVSEWGIRIDGSVMAAAGNYSTFIGGTEVIRQTTTNFWDRTGTIIIGSAADLDIARAGAASLRIGSAANPFLNTTDDVKTTHTAEGISVANVGARKYLGASCNGVLTVINEENSGFAIYVLRGANNATVESIDSLGSFTITLGTASSTNIGYDAAGANGAGYYIENNMSAARTYRMIFQGSGTSCVGA